MHEHLGSLRAEDFASQVSLGRLYVEQRGHLHARVNCVHEQALGSRAPHDELIESELRLKRAQVDVTRRPRLLSYGEDSIEEQ
jgi:hypothetical protein